MLIISTPKDTPFSTRRIELDGVDYFLTLEWNMRGGWFLGLSDSEGVEIFSPRRLVADYDILSAVTDRRRPRGRLYCIDQTGRAEDPTFESLGDRHWLVYFEEGE